MMSRPSGISGVQEKAFGALANGVFVINDNGDYIGKYPYSSDMDHINNELVSMELIHLMNIDVPYCVSVMDANGRKCFVSKRFDLDSLGNKLDVQDYCAFLNIQSENKYDGATYEDAIMQTPQAQRLELFKRIFASFIIGNSDMHFKNISIFTGSGKLTPAYDILNIQALDSKSSGELGYSPELYSDQLVSHKINKIHFEELGKRCGLATEDRESVYAQCVSAVNNNLDSVVGASALSEQNKMIYIQTVKSYILQFNDLSFG